MTSSPFVTVRAVGSVRACAIVGLTLAAACLAGGCGSDPARPRAAQAGPSPTATPIPSSPTPAARPVAVLWGLERPQRAVRRLGRHPAVVSATAVGRGVALLRASAGERGRVVERIRAGYAVPLDVVSIRPEGYAATLPDESRRPFDDLRPGRAVISRTSARLRGIGRGGELRLVTGRRLRVSAVVEDAIVRGAEVAVDRDDPRVRPSDRASVLAVLRPGASVRPRSLARYVGRNVGARILPGGPAADTELDGPIRPGELKARFGEPAVGLPYGDDWVRLDPAFVNRYLVTRRVPILGAVNCHRAMIAPLRAALGELRRRGLTRLVNPGDYAGCYAPRRIRPGGPLSLHAWGLAVDLNATANPFGGRSRQDPRLVRTMLRHGFSWGGDWPTIRDPMHFEYRGR
jgi:D-alanyl-D-alanine carboxypeptidase